MYLIQDIVVNHVGNYFTYSGTYDPAQPCQGFEPIPNSLAAGQSLPPPLNLNQCNNPEAQQAAIYHWTPQIADHNDLNQQLTYQLSDLDDLNTATPAVRDYLKQSYRYWIEQLNNVNRVWLLARAARLTCPIIATNLINASRSIP